MRGGSFAPIHLRCRRRTYKHFEASSQTREIKRSPFRDFNQWWKILRTSQACNRVLIANPFNATYYYQPLASHLSLFVLDRLRRSSDSGDLPGNGTDSVPYLHPEPEPDSRTPARHCGNASPKPDAVFVHHSTGGYHQQHCPQVWRIHG